MKIAQSCGEPNKLLKGELIILATETSKRPWQKPVLMQVHLVYSQLPRCRMSGHNQQRDSILAWGAIITQQHPSLITLLIITMPQRTFCRNYAIFWLCTAAAHVNTRLVKIEYLYKTDMSVPAFNVLLSRWMETPMRAWITLHKRFLCHGTERLAIFWDIQWSETTLAVWILSAGRLNLHRESKC